jgi:tetratricopeptide (TPR) repeat protein
VTEQLRQQARRVAAVLASPPASPSIDAAHVAAILDLSQRDAVAVIEQLVTEGHATRVADGTYGLSSPAGPSLADHADLARSRLWRVSEVAYLERRVHPQAMRATVGYPPCMRAQPTPAAARPMWATRRDEWMALLTHECTISPTWLGAVMAEAVWGLAWHSGAVADADAALRMGIGALDPEDTPTRAVFDARRAGTLSESGQHADALDHADRAVGAAYATSDGRLRQIAMLSRSRALRCAGQNLEAVVTAATAWELARGNHDTRGEALCQLELGRAYLDLGQTADAQCHLIAAAGMAGARGEKVGQARALTYLATAHLQALEHGEALAVLDSALPVLRDHGNTQYLAEALHVLARAHRHEGGDSDEARDASVHASALFLEAGRPERAREVFADLHPGEWQ